MVVEGGGGDEVDLGDSSGCRQFSGLYMSSIHAYQMYRHSGNSSKKTLHNCYGYFMFSFSIIACTLLSFLCCIVADW